VLGHGLGDERVRQLEQEGAAAAEQQDEFAVHAANDRIRGK
jgi:hypothetical protein